jgi:hypothetical protein
MFNKIVFFHNHVNGDCFLSRILVNQIIEASKLDKTNYYYTAPRSYTSHCSDLGIPDENFNVIHVPNTNIIFYILNNILFINVWIGINTNTKLDLNATCGLCLNNLIPKYNWLISKLNDKLNMNIQLLDETPGKSPYLPFINKGAYNNKFIEDFIEHNKKIYEKVILICNNSPTTFISTIDITKRYLLGITEKFPNYLFITFQKTLLQKENLISIQEIYEKTNTQITNNWGIMFPLLSKLADKVILLPTGPSLTCFNNETTKDKFMMLFDYSASGNPGGCFYCHNNRDYLCTIRFNWEIKIMDVNFADKDINNKIYYFIEDFLQK